MEQNCPQAEERVGMSLGEGLKVSVAWGREGGLHEGHGIWDLEGWWELR